MTITASPVWNQLKQQSIDIASIKTLFDDNPTRFNDFTVKDCGLLLDYSKNRINDQVMSSLLNLAQDSQLSEKITAMFAGEPINSTENRAVLHTALRAEASKEIVVDGHNIMPEIQHTLAKMAKVVDDIYSGVWRGYSGKKITDVVAIGIGGSFLGPKIISQALRPYWNEKLTCHFLANIDGSAITEKLKQLNPATTLFIISSKSFSTQETRVNALTAKNWFIEQTQEQNIEQHFFGITANVDKAVAFGLNEKNILPLWDWVGGRYSLWSAIGLPIALLIGMDNFYELLAGARSMDDHFCSMPLSENMPVILGLLGVLYRNIYEAQSHLILPYDHYLRGFPAYIQQLDMESNGKSTSLNGEAIDYDTGMVIWGGEGVNGQHAYHQLLHQGTSLIPVDFILPLSGHHQLPEHHKLLAANCFAQSKALMQGKTFAEVMTELKYTNLSEVERQQLAAHKVMAGNNPSNTILMDKLTPLSLGALIALYEHKTFVQGVIWNINSFDQWGVELGKVLGDDIAERLDETIDTTALDSSSNGLINLFRQQHI